MTMKISGEKWSPEIVRTGVLARLRMDGIEARARFNIDRYAVVVESKQPISSTIRNSVSQLLKDAGQCDVEFHAPYLSKSPTKANRRARIAWGVG